MLHYKNIGVISNQTVFKSNLNYNMGNYCSLEYKNTVHFHEFYELEFILKGNCRQVFNGTEMDMNQGTMYLLTPSDYHGYSDNNNNDFNFFSIQFTPNFIHEDILNVFPTFKGPLIAHFEPREYDYISQLCYHMLLENKQCQFKSEMIIQHSLSVLILLLLRTVPFKQSQLTDSKDSRICKAICYMQQNYQKKITQCEVAEAVNLSTGYFCESFKKAMLMSFSTYLRHLRLDHAKQLIIATDLTFDQICYESGFQNFAYFSKSFKQYFGESPRFYRKTN